MVVGREQDPRAQPRRVVQVFRDGPGDRKSIESRGPRPISSSRTRLRRAALAQDRGGLAHLDHEGALAGGQRVGGPDPGEDPVGDADPGAPRGHERAHLGEQRDQRDLAQQGRLPGHVRAGQDQEADVLAVQRDVVRDERRARARSTTGCRPASISSASDRSTSGRTQSRSRATRARATGRRRARRSRARGRAHPVGLGAQARAELRRARALGRGGALARAQGHALPALELVGRVALAARPWSACAGSRRAPARGAPCVTSIDQPNTRL